MATPINTIYSWFETGDFPTQAQFRASWSSFWHKDEAIPMTNISGLSDQFGKFVLGSTFNTHLSDQNAHPYFAKKDASNLTPTNVNDWKAKLGVGDLPENIATYDYDLHDHVMMKDGTTKEATDLGKNIANSSLTSIAGSGMTLGAPYTWNAANQPFSITGLPDKSADATFDRFRVQNSLGQEAMITNAYGILKDTFVKMTATQALELGQLINGGVGSEGAMSVNLISPPIIQKIDSNEYILLRGANLKLSVLSKKIEILNAVTNVLVATIPDSQIQIYDDGITLVFYYNFKDFPFGEYKIKLTSGSKTYETTLTLTVVNNVNNVNLDDITWDIAYFEPADANVANNASGRSVNMFTPVTTAINYRVALKSSQIFAQGEDFYLEFNLKVGLSGRMGSSGTPHLAKSYVGLGYSSTPLTLATNSLINANFNYKASGSATVSTIFNNGLNAIFGMSSSINSDQTQTVIFIKTGNLFRTIIGNTNDSVVLSNNSGYSMFITLVGRVSLVDMEVQLVKAYTF